MDSLADTALYAHHEITPVQWLEDTFTIRRSLGIANPCSGAFISVRVDLYDGTCSCQTTNGVQSFGGKAVSYVTWNMPAETKAGYVEWLGGFDWTKEDPPRYLA